MRAILAIIGIGWIVFWVGWLIAAFTAKSSQGGAWGGLGGGLRVGLAIVIVVLIRRQHRARAPCDRQPAARRHRARRVGRRARPGGLGQGLHRQELGHADDQARTSPNLVTTGPYRLIRHPIYTGIILAVTGTALATSLYGLIAAAVLLAYFGYSARTEERFLAERFPDTFPPYKARTKMLIPFVV